MSYELKKPITDEQRNNFIVEYNHNQGLRIEDTEMFLFALEKNEIMGEKEIEIEVPDYGPETGEQTGTHIETIIVPYPVIDPDYDEKQEEKREAEFFRAFFNTSLGYIRRKVNMADGSKKDFLSDLLPIISMGFEKGQEIQILTYKLPDFSKDIVDWTKYQQKKTVTLQFLAECFNQLSNDFLPSGE